METTQQSLHVENPTLQHKSRSLRTGPARVYIGLTIFFVCCVAIQVFLAGAGIFVSSSWLTWHGLLGSTLVLLPLFMLIVGLISRLPRHLNWLNGLLIILVILQPILIYVPRGQGLALLSALHPVNALVIFSLPLFLIFQTWQKTTAQ